MEGPLLWVVIGVLLLASFGGIAYIIPTKLQRVLASTRQSVREYGLDLSSMVIPDLDAAPEDRVSSGGKRLEKNKVCVAYQYPLIPDLEPELHWQLIRKSKSKVPIEGWILKDSIHQNVDLIDTDFWSEISTLIQELPDRCYSLGVERRLVFWAGSESKDLLLSDRFLPELTESMKKFEKICRGKSESIRKTKVENDEYEP